MLGGHCPVPYCSQILLISVGAAPTAPHLTDFVTVLLMSAVNQASNSVGEEEDEVFWDSEASPELRRSTRTSARKRSSTGGLLTTKPKKREKKIIRSPARTDTGASADRTPQAGAVTPAAAHPAPINPMLANMQALLSGMESRLSQATTNLHSSVTDQIEGAMTAIGDLGKRVEKNEDKIKNMMDEIGSMVDSRIAAGLEKLNLPGGVSSPATDQSGHCPLDQVDPGPSTYAAAVSSSRSGPPIHLLNSSKWKEEDFWRCRKTLRLRPIVPDGLSVNEAVVEFMKKTLRLDEEFISSVGNFNSTVVPFGPKSRYRHEVVVLFDSVEARDIVRGAAPNLASQESDTGIRLEVPYHLRSHMKALQQMSYNIKQKHHAARRNILYDDESMDLVLDFCLGADLPWRRLTAAQAKSKSKTIKQTGKEAVNDEEIDVILNGAVCGGQSGSGSQE